MAYLSFSLLFFCSLYISIEIWLIPSRILGGNNSRFYFFCPLCQVRRRNDDLDDKRRKNRMVQDAVAKQIKTLQVKGPSQEISLTRSAKKAQVLRLSFFFKSYIFAQIDHRSGYPRPIKVWRHFPHSPKPLLTLVLFLNTFICSNYIILYNRRSSRTTS